MVETKAYYQALGVTQYCGHAIDVLSQLGTEIAQTCVTSPPYWGLRKYAGEQEVDFASGKCAFGLERSPELYVEHTVGFLGAIRRVLRKDGVVFWNIGDSYNGSGGAGGDYNRGGLREGQPKYPGRNVLTLKPKDLCLIPFRVAIAAQEDGWWVRSVIIWSKSNPMPESVRDRPTESHEYILMFTKSAKYYWDTEAVKEPVAESTINRGPVDFGGAKGREYQPLEDDPNFRNGSEQWGRTFDYRISCANGRNLRSVWGISTQPFKGAHFAVFPEKIPERCILAATSEKGNCSKCGAPWVRIIEKAPCPHNGYTEDKNPDPQANGRRIALMRQAAREQGHEYVNKTKTLGWKPTCSCEAPTEPALVIDPFSGSGRTLLVAARLGRQAIGVDTSKEYCDLAIQQIEVEKQNREVIASRKAAKTTNQFSMDLEAVHET
jgi:DNA modification methylase